MNQVFSEWKPLVQWKDVLRVFSHDSVKLCFFVIIIYAIGLNLKQEAVLSQAAEMCIAGLRSSVLFRKTEPRNARNKFLYREGLL